MSDLTPAVCTWVIAKHLVLTYISFQQFGSTPEAAKTMRELTIPFENEGDENAVEMARVWLGNGTCNVSLLLGMYEDAEESDEDELEVWGNILSDIAQHIAHGFKQSHEWDEVETMSRLRKHFNAAIKERAPGLTGHFLDEH